MILLEGGNVFKDNEGNPRSKTINQTDVKPTVMWLEQLTGLPLLDNMLGSTGLKAESGDLDLGVDKATTSKEKLVSILKRWVESHGLRPDDYIAGHKSAGKPADKEEQVHFLAPVAGYPERGYVQVDFMLEPDLEWAKFAKRSDATSQYKDTAKHILINTVSRTLVSKDHPEGFSWSAGYGLKDRATGEQYKLSPDELAEFILGQGHTRKDLAGVETIIQALENNPKRDEILAQAKQDFEKRGFFLNPIKEGAPDWYSAMMRKIS
jgi:hypothetical protein